MERLYVFTDSKKQASDLLEAMLEQWPGIICRDVLEHPCAVEMSLRVPTRAVDEIAEYASEYGEVYKG